jgi:uncharacterized oxidoreductase
MEGLMAIKSQRRVLITGGSSGIGFEMAKQMVAQGSAVIICGRSQKKLDDAKKRIPQVITLRCDITRSEDRAALFQEVSANFKNLNMLINNAGISMRYLLSKTGDLESRIVTEWETNFLAPTLLAQKFLPILIENRGTIVNVTSGLSYIPLSIEPSYCASKAALHSMTQSMRIQFGKLGVKVAEIFFPAVDTPFQGQHAPANAMKPNEAAALALQGLNNGKEEIRVKMAGLIYMMSRLMPKRALKMINGFIPDNVEELLKKE